MKKRYPTIAYLDEHITSKIRVLQKEIFELTGARASLEEWDSHISVGKALYLNEKEFDEIKVKFENIVKNKKPIKIQLTGFGFKDNWRGAKVFNAEPYACNIGIVVNNELLELVEEIDNIQRGYDYKYDIFPYKPHVTLAFKDLDEIGYKKAQKYLKNKNFDETTTIKSFSIAAEVNGEYIEVLNFRFCK